MILQRETIAIPVVKGVNLTTSARLVEPPQLLQAQNVRFDGGAKKRSGHRAHIIRSGSYTANQTRLNFDDYTLTPYGAKVLDSDWLFGWGAITGTTRGSNTATNEIGPYPEAGYTFGGAQRDDEILAWTGHSLISHSPSQLTTNALVAPAVMPALRATSIAKIQTRQEHPDAADNGKVRMVCWLDPDVNQVYYTALDSVTGATLANKQSLGMVDPWHPRIFSLGDYFHIVVVERDGANALHVKSIHQSTLTTIGTRSLGTCDNYFDVWKVDDTRAVVLKVDATVLKTRWVGVNGSSIADESDATLTMDAEQALECAIALHPITNELGVAFLTTATSFNPSILIGSIYDRAGNITGTLNLGSIPGAAIGAANTLTIAPKYLPSTSNLGIFDVYVSYLDSNTRIERRRFSDGGTHGSTTKHHLKVVSHAFSVGDRTYVWAGYNSTLQSTWFLLDEALNPIGKLDFAVADPGETEGNIATLRSVNFKTFNTVRSQAVFHLALGYRVRVPTASTSGLVPGSTTAADIFTEPSIKFVELDFLPRLRSAQAGRCTYFAGAQLWMYDGQSLAESGFHIAPESTLAESNTAGGVLATTQTYSYRVDLCHKNAQGEEIRSHSLVKSFTLTGVNDTITLTIKTAPSVRSDAYFLIYRTAVISGAPTTTFYLVNSRDPDSTAFRSNNQANATVEFIDDGTWVSDANLISRELHPFSPTYVQPFPAPASEVIASGRDRLWLAGGEIPFGQVAPSRLFSPFDTPAFNANLNIQVDRNEEPITAVGFVGDLAVIFRENETYLLEGDGPDNVSNGFWPPARLAVSDSGAKSQEGVVRAVAGLFFQGPSGIRVISPGGQVTPIGGLVDNLVADLTLNAAVSIPYHNEVRWYADNSAIVYNYLDDAWSTWTIGARWAGRKTSGQGANLVRADSYFWLEDDSVYRDGDLPYEMVIQFPWLHAGSLGDFQRIRRLAGFGSWDGSTIHKVKVSIAYDERAHPEEYWEWTVPDSSQNDDNTWGGDDWGTGIWGDLGANSTVANLRDSVWRFRRRPRRQKCSVFSVTVSDKQSDNKAFTLTALGLELARKPGLDRIAAVAGGSDTFR